MRKLYWFGVGVLIVALLALGAETAYGQNVDDPKLTANSMRKDIEDNTATGHHYVTYVLGLARGAYFSYVSELHRAGMPEKDAMAVASVRCGRLTPFEIFDILIKDKQLGDAPIHLSMPYFVSAVCHRGDVNS